MNIFKSFSLAAILMALTLTSCSEIDENERIIYVKPAEVKKHVLIEDFTG